MREPTGETETTFSNNNVNSNLQDSEFTADSESEPEPSGRWFGGVGSDFLHIANCLTENVSPVVSGVATLVHRTAVTVANEIAQLERDEEAETHEAVEELSPKKNRGGTKKGAGKAIIFKSSSFDSTSNSSEPERLILPWEIREESQTNSSQEKESDDISVYFTDTELMKKILNLSCQESTFLEPFSQDSTKENENISLPSYSSAFVLDDSRIKLIRRILDIDENLSSMHNRLTGGATDSWDTFFWKNYFFHCELTRADELHQRKQKKMMITSCTPTKIVKKDCSSPKRENFKMKNSMEKVDIFISEDSHIDDESLVPVYPDTEEQQDDNSSYVIQSAPNSVDTFTTTRSVDDDVVIVDTYRED